MEPKRGAASHGEGKAARKGAKAGRKGPKAGGAKRAARAAPKRVEDAEGKRAKRAARDAARPAHGDAAAAEGAKPKRAARGAAAAAEGSKPKRAARGAAAAAEGAKPKRAARGAAAASEGAKPKRAARGAAAASEGAKPKRASRGGGAPLSEREARGELFDRVAGDAPYLGVSAAGADFVVATSDMQVGRSLFVKGIRPEMGALGRAVRLVESLRGEGVLDGTTFLDVGANIGTTTVAAMVSHGFGAGVACEPDEHNQRVLRANLALNGLDERVRAISAAVSDRTGRGELVGNPGKSGIAWVALKPGEVDAWRERRSLRFGVPESELPSSVVDVELVTLDGLAEDGVFDPESVGMLWVDAEGHEGHVLQGASRLTELGVPAVLEYHPDHLRLRNGLELVHAALERHYTHFIDVRRGESDGSREPSGPQPIAELPGYGERFADGSGASRFTDLLLLRLDANETSGSFR